MSLAMIAWPVSVRAPATAQALLPLMAPSGWTSTIAAVIRPNRVVSARRSHSAGEGIAGTSQASPRRGASHSFPWAKTKSRIPSDKPSRISA